ncbi:MAG: rhomboid family intramembrane serine protease [Methylococcales symbiont of Iophon sp. n. MRB-2018]|nr:MAG: rhomboid family intramembrane serine protease [Methylococcales symbiont of Iophon sp. n. MRB-2018]KAF3979236.1 MAG: rhomboid family intramembrane serine protease [Methylococcales symbiont of Iophon sp. n. MRB-2018]
MIPIRDNVPCKSRPYVSWSIMAICISVFLLMKMMPDEIQRQLTYIYGMVPIRYSNPQWSASFGLDPDYHLSFFTSMFLHGGWLHILSNMWFMWIFAKSIEDRMGHAKFLVFYLSSGLIASYVQWHFSPELVIPVVGASGAIAAVLGAYLVLYPFARVVIWFPLFFLPIFFQLPAIAFLGFWAIIQFQNATSSILFDGVIVDVAWWEHLGGFIAGAILHTLFVNDEKPVLLPGADESD